MKIAIVGAAGGEVTGSADCVQSKQARVLVDCGFPKVLTTAHQAFLSMNRNADLLIGPVRCAAANEPIRRSALLSFRRFMGSKRELLRRILTRNALMDIARTTVANLEALAGGKPYLEGPVLI